MSKGKRPAFQFYPADWLTDLALRSCSVAARGLWIDMICLMHDGRPYGHLTVGKKVLAEADVARIAGVSAEAVEPLLAELEGAEVFSRNRSGVIFSRRLVRDEAIRERRSAGGMLGKEHGAKGASYGKLGGRPPKGGFDENRKPPPSSPSSSSSSKETTHTAPRGAAREGFDEFWERYPVKKSKQASLKAWAKLRPSNDLRERILADVAVRLEKDSDWLRGAIPYPATYLNGERWTDEVRSAPRPGNGISHGGAPQPGINPNVLARRSCGCEEVRTPEGRKTIPCGRHTQRATEVRM